MDNLFPGQMRGKRIASLVLPADLFLFFFAVFVRFWKVSRDFRAVVVGYLNGFFLSRSERWPYWKRFKMLNWPFRWSIVSDKTLILSKSPWVVETNKSFSIPISSGSWEGSKILSKSVSKIKTLFFIVWRHIHTRYRKHESIKIYQKSSIKIKSYR